MSIMSEQNCDVHLHVEIEKLKQTITEKQSQLIAMETACLRDSDRHVELEDSIIAWQDKYDRLYDSHKRVQKVNQNLEDKLLKLVDRNSGERAQLTSDVATLSVRLAQANYNIAKLQGEIERYKTDMGLAIQLLQCKPDSFVSQKVSTLPLEIQSKVSQYMRLDTNSHSDSEGSTSGVGVITSNSYRVLPASDSPPPLCPFPPTAMVYSMRGLGKYGTPEMSETLTNDQMISPSIMAKFLEDELKESETKHCDTCQCPNKDLTVLADMPKSFSTATQTIVQGNANNSLCLRCNSNLNSPSRANSPYIMKLIKSSDSVISETKSSVSDSNDNDKLFTPVKKDDLMVNPILGHHRLCDRTTPKKVLSPMQLVQTTSVASSVRGDVTVEKESTMPLLANSITLSERRSSTKEVEVNTPSASGKELIDAKCGESLQETATGSTNSLWSKTSSNTNVEGAKIFENFNRNLIKTIKAENPKVTGPRFCALRIQNGSNNILLDNIESDVSPVVYTRRSRFLDEELDDTKDIITTLETGCDKSKLSKPISLVMTNPLPPNGNKTDSEKFREAHSKENSVTKMSLRKDMQKKSIVDKAAEHIEMNSSRIAKSCTQSSSISSEVDIQESAMLRRQQLNRVAEWVHNSTQLEACGQASRNSSMEALSIDSGYKTKVNNHTSNELGDSEPLLSNSVTPCTTNDQNSSHISTQPVLLCDDNKLLGNTNVINNNNSCTTDYAQTSHYDANTNLLNNNATIAVQCSSNDTILARSVALGKYLDEANATTSLNGDGIQSSHDASCLTGVVIGDCVTDVALNNCSSKLNNAQVDLAQMEYNVKQFLLKQNEWSIHNRATPSPKPTRNNPHRTETNL